MAISTFLLLTGCAPTGVSKQSRDVGNFYNVVFFLAVVVFVGVNGALVYFVMKYRRKPTDVDMPPQIHGSTAAEITWTVIPALIVFGLFGMSWSTMHAVDKKSAHPSVVINVQGFQWNWQFNYGNNFIVKADPANPKAIPRILVPVNEPIRFVLTSDNVIHSFYLPDILFKRDVIPGRQNAFDVTFDTTMVLKGQCAEFCGTNHAAMNFEVQTINRADFDKWVKDTKAASGAANCKGEPKDALEINAPAGQIAFDKDCLVAAAGKPVKVTFSNGGGPQPHNFAVSKSSADLKPIATSGAPFKSGSQTAEVPAQPAGLYYFYCQVHPVMNGTYKVQ